MGGKNNFVNLRLTDTQTSFIRDLTGNCFGDNMSEAIRFCIDFLNVMLSKGMVVDLSDNPELAEKLNQANITTDWDGISEETH